MSFIPLAEMPTAFTDFNGLLNYYVITIIIILKNNSPTPTPKKKVAAFGGIPSYLGAVIL